MGAEMASVQLGDDPPSRGLDNTKTIGLGHVARRIGTRFGQPADVSAMDRLGSLGMMPMADLLLPCALRAEKKGRPRRPLKVQATGSGSAQSACLRRKAGISISSMPLLDRASTLAAAWVRPVRQTLGVFMPWKSAVAMPLVGAAVATTGLLSTGRLSVPVRSIGWATAWAWPCTTCSGAAARLAEDRPVAITVARSWSPRLSS